MQGCASGRGESRHRLSHYRKFDFPTRRGLRPAGMRSLPLRPCADPAIPHLPTAPRAAHRPRSHARAVHRLARFADSRPAAKPRLGGSGGFDQSTQSSRLRSRSTADSGSEAAPDSDAHAGGTWSRQSRPGGNLVGRLESDARPPATTRGPRLPSRSPARWLHARHAPVARATSGPFAAGRMSGRFRCRRRRRGP